MTTKANKRFVILTLTLRQAQGDTRFFYPMIQKMT